MKEAIEYILRFLLRDDNLLQYVGYTDNKNDWHKYKVVVVPSGFFCNSTYGKPESIPHYPLPTYHNLPVIYGKAHIEESDGAIICHIDVVASAYFLISRYEEFVNSNSNRDEHGRYVGRNSLPARHNFIHRPIVEEYGELLCNLLQQQGMTITPTPQKINNTYLTHDVDFITHYHRIRGVLGGIKRALTGGNDKIKQIILAQKDILQDPAYTFPWIVSTDNRLPGAKKIYFFKAADKSKSFDYPQYNLQGKDVRHLFNLIKNATNLEIGLHYSYASGSNPLLIHNELNRLQNSVPEYPIISGRHHYLRSLQPQDMEILIKEGITDDYTMGYADIAGFRLGTCRAVRFINPATRELTNLILHPLTVMDCTLSDPKYMNLSENEAFDTTKQLIDATRRHNGDLCLLWHNTIFTTPASYHTSLYDKIIKHLCQIEKR